MNESSFWKRHKKFLPHVWGIDETVLCYDRLARPCSIANNGRATALVCATSFKVGAMAQLTALVGRPSVSEN